MSRAADLENLLAPVVAAQGCELWGLEFSIHGRHSLLRVYIDSPVGVTLEDCERISRQISAVMDVEDPIASAYTLEVSSPGLDRPLKRPEDYQRFTGSRMKLMTRQPVNGNRHFEGRLQSFENGRLTLETMKGRQKAKPGHPIPTGERIEIDLANVEKANLVPEI